MTRVVILTSGERGFILASDLLQRGYEIAKVIFNSESKLRSYTEKLAAIGIDGDFSTDVNSQEGLEKTFGSEPDVVVVAGFSQILRQGFIDKAPNGVLNLHPGRLPQYRGGSPLNWQLINGESDVGLSVILVDQGIDTGPVVASTTTAIHFADDIKSMHERANGLFPELTHQAIKSLLGGKSFRDQNEADARYWHQRNDADGEIRWAHMSPTQVRNFVRALTHPYPGAFGLLQETRVRIFSVAEISDVMQGTPGRVGFLSGKGPWVQCRGGAVLLDEYVIEDGDKSRLSTGDHLKA